IPGLDSIPYYTNETIFDLNEAVHHLIVLGGGAAGMELAQAHRMLGAHVTVIDSADVLGDEDPEAAKILMERFSEQSIVMHSGTRVERVSRVVQGIGVHIGKQGETEIVKGSHVLVATGRKPNVKGLNLERAGVGYTPNGIKVNQQLRTSNARVYAI